ncbi:MAG TPA: P1 family peptidase [Rhizobiaceae bacterium]|nr:P1 family peptidase [Rhizobiaceae bacterium]
MSNPHFATPSGKPRARAFRIPFLGTPGTNNAITDVAGVAVGYTTLIAGDSIRTGVTAILPRPRAELATPMFAGMFSQNGNGELTGWHLIEEMGAFNFPITITNTHSCGVTRDATIRWMRDLMPDALDSTWGLPVAGETYDGFLNDINGFHIANEHVFAALDGATSGPIEEGSVGGGTGMITFGFKAGSGTASRIVEWAGKRYTVGVFVQSNFGKRWNFSIRGRNVGRELTEPSMREGTPLKEKSSIIAIAATDAPFLPHQMKRLARRIPLGVAAAGGFGYNSSGDIFLAFSTANPDGVRAGPGTLGRADFIPDADIDPFFDAVIQSTEEAILNALVANDDMTGINGNFVPALPKMWLEKNYARTA